MPSDFLTDPLWYKDAVIYELHVRSFYDADNDGFGDFAGLRKKLPYLEELGVNTLWLLPFLESPLRDDGYDTADYLKILPVHGTMEDFEAFMEEAHGRGMRVITELVLNHTSDQHPWFQEARDPNSPRHDWYVWSETTDKYQEARIIFTDTEMSNWTWDRRTGKYYWHRFFSHQPDLNFDNPAVREAMKEIMFFWLDKGVDGLRLDAVPYLYEREGTNCENLPETIEYIKSLRTAIEERYGPGRVLLAEANQWPEDTLPYFADGEGVQMAFNFPIMPRLYMALRRENRRPFVEMLEFTEDIPAEAQWAIFLRNHDELTLEMVTDEERDYMYNEYAADQRFRINVGIRRRLAPLLGGERRRIELMNALLLALKGSPIIYYGDEIAMGDDPFLGDRNGVRTPMQWSNDKNGGFSRAPIHRLFMPPIDRGPYSYEFINVEDAENDPHSLLNFMKRLLALRKHYEKVFGRGTLELVPVDNQSVLAFVREYEGRKVLIVANLSRFAQSTMLPPSDEYHDLVPVELFGQTPFPKFEDQPYHILLAPHGFYWFALEHEEDVEELHPTMPERLEIGDMGTLPLFQVTEGLHNLLIRTMVQGRHLERLEMLLPDFLQKQRWYGAKGETIESVELQDAVRIQRWPFPVYLSIVRVTTTEDTNLYVLPLALAYHDDADEIAEQRPEACLAWVDGPRGRGLLHDAAVNPGFWMALFEWWQDGGKGRSLQGLYIPSLDPSVRGFEAEEVKLLSGEQSNSAAVVGGKFFVKLYRRLERGINPETELLDYLTDVGFPFIPKLHGTLTFKRALNTFALGTLQEALAVDTDGWSHARTQVIRFLHRQMDLKPPSDEHPPEPHADLPAWLENDASEMVSLSQTLGIRTAELHRSFARAKGRDLSPEPGSMEYAESFVERVRREADETRRLLREHETTPDQVPDEEDWERAFDRLDALLEIEPLEERIRIHGDYHLGQVLRADGEYYVLDFEGEPARSLEERRRRDYAMRDVAGMLRSIEYAALSALHDHEDEDENFPAWIDRLIEWCHVLFLDAYFDTAGENAFARPIDSRPDYLWAYLFDKVLYEVRYEIRNRPSWAWLPLKGLHRLLRHATPATDADVPIEPADVTA